MKQAMSLKNQFIQIKEYLTNGQVEAALSKAEALQSQEPNNLDVLRVVAQLYEEINSLAQLQNQLELIHQQFPDELQAVLQLAKLHHRLGNNKQSLDYINQAELLAPENTSVLHHKSLIYRNTYQYNDAINYLQKIVDLGGATSAVWNNLGLVHQNIGLFDLAESYYLKAAESADRQDATAYNNQIQLNHYIPNSSSQKIFNLTTRWERKYAQHLQLVDLNTHDNTANKVLKIGLVSGGFRMHPVGQMITRILELLPQHEIELIAYSSNLQEDYITKRIKNTVSQWHTIEHLKGKKLAEKIASDDIDILFDLSGHMSGSRMTTMAMKPAPILVKWVGGLINTTGLSTMDYLLSDKIETPIGVDEWYTEKLIRMPHDYVCYEAPAYSHDVYSPPVTRNGYITLGCFNNPQKINNVVLEQWANIMHHLPNSRLFLKSFEFNSSVLVNNVTNTMAELGISAERLTLEGPSNHNELLKAYNKVDIALDPWPYSGGLTTCEAMFMGVPVVTYPGPTFAGRHSATHLTNVGLGQLVADSWDDYCNLVLNLANDIDNLTNIRKHLRNALLESPLCDAQSFARNFSNAMRAIWQRHCAEKAPAALTLDAEGQCQFADEDHPVTLQLPLPTAPATDEDFSFHLQDHIIALEHGTNLANRPYFRDFLRKGGVNYICLDPAGALSNTQQLQQTGLFQHFPLTVLGDGSKVDLKLAVNAEESTTLPLSKEYTDNTIELISCTEVASHRLDNIAGLDSLDWLILDNKHDNKIILQHGQNKLANALLIDISISFLPEHTEQVGLTTIKESLAKLGLELLTVNKKSDDADFGQAIFIPSQQKLAQLDSNQLMKLAFLLDTVYSDQDTAHKTLKFINKELANTYLHKNELMPTSFSNTHHVNTSQEDQKLKIKNGRYLNWQLDEKIVVVDIGANPIDGLPPYYNMLKSDMISLVGFEPQKEALKQLNKIKGPNELYLPYAVGDGNQATLYICQASGMTSTLKPNFDVLNQFQGYPEWAKIKEEEVIKTVRLDDLDEIKDIDWLKIDIQGGELTVFENAEEKLKNTLIIQTEVNFIQLYENQPLFAEIDQWMRNHGFILHTLLEERKRLYSPMVINNQIHNGINQLTTADAVYIKDIFSGEKSQKNELVKLAAILHHAYGSYDLAYKIIDKLDNGSSEKYLNTIPNKLNISIQKNKTLHICFNNPHVQGLIKALSSNDNNSSYEHIFLIEQSRSIPDWDIEVPKSNKCFLFKKEYDLKKVLKKCMESDVDKIIFHGLFFTWQKELLLKIKNKNISWIVWGGDLYNDLGYKKNIVKHINTIGTVADNDYKIFEKHYGVKKHLPFRYITPYDYTKLKQPSIKNKTIIIGNSGDASNEHLDILEALSKKKDIKNYKLLIPLSYNTNSNYLTKIKIKIADLNLDKNSYLITNFLPADEHFKMLANADVLVTAHNRAQAGANILASLFFGNATILKKDITIHDVKVENPGWTRLVDMNISPIDYQDFLLLDEIAMLPKPSEVELCKIKNSIISERGFNAAINIDEEFFINS
ncbi:TDP-N-acetylfucosamine:lipid II N-acetylfucosaminyltransferase [Oceanisphaera pacifica]|uniref:protein O-GlcNAc transferase n=1 Tax=Oceanisphaera pacifica TaxID=2818389 RepID=A0ABS3NJF8_9GAMM|nr:TDP-N-acetylfucosamine:lipid II N-acetylfucosaminyltransferase [Oceanisphaera pacifica]MBO1520736.1 TDP-N-acetylfucosamine:lipid II N-acetylfucosaminyltransferase [Oceanisphaera pacifica]